jgi:hypothetical protein
LFITKSRTHLKAKFAQVTFGFGALDDKKQNAKEKGMTKLEFLNTVFP